MKKTAKIILICTLIAAIGALAIYVAFINRAESTPTISAPTKIDKIANDEIPVETTQEDYSEFYNRIIPANSDNGNVGDHVRGNEKSKVTVIEYADLQCPACAVTMMYMSNLYKKNSDRAAFIFRHFPLTIHPNAGVAALATESAGQQGYFWEMTENLYSSQGAWGKKTGDDLRDYFISTFKKIAPNGDVDKFTANLENDNFITKAAFDRNLGRTYHNVHATPAIFVNGKEFTITDYEKYDDFAKAVQAEIDRILAE